MKLFCFLFVSFLPFLSFCSEKVFSDGSRHLYFVYPQKRAISSPALVTSGVFSSSFDYDLLTSQRSFITETSFDSGNYALFVNYVFSSDWPNNFLNSLQIGEWTPTYFTYVPFAISDPFESLLARLSFPSPPAYQASFFLPFTVKSFISFIKFFCTVGCTVTYSIYKYSDSDSLPSSSSSTNLYPSDDSGFIHPDSVPGGDIPGTGGEGGEGGGTGGEGGEGGGTGGNTVTGNVTGTVTGTIEDGKIDIKLDQEINIESSLDVTVPDAPSVSNPELPLGEFGSLIRGNSELSIEIPSESQYPEIKFPVPVPGHSNFKVNFFGAMENGIVFQAYETFRKGFKAFCIFAISFVFFRNTFKLFRKNS